MSSAAVDVWRAPTEPPPFFRLVGHPLRWRIMRELVQSDRPVSELRELLGEPQSLVSYHLRQLREGGLVARRQSSADRRDSYYAIDLAACQALLLAAGDALHPGIVLEPAAPPVPIVRTGPQRRPRVLFLCTGNSARSQMAEALLVDLSDRAVEAASAGSHPKPLHADAVRVMQARGIDISTRESKHVDTLARQRFDLVVTLCDRVREICPELPDQPALMHWSIPDPAFDASADGADGQAFERTAAELETRIRFLLGRLGIPSPTTHQPARSRSHVNS